MIRAKFLANASELISSKIKELHKDLIDLQSGIAADDKSSAGDKYETSREMSQQEILKISTRLSELKKQNNSIQLYTKSSSATEAQAGVLVITSLYTVFIGISIGNILIEDQTIIGIASNSPLAHQLFGKKVGDYFQIGQQKGQILEIH